MKSNMAQERADDIKARRQKPLAPTTEARAIEQFFERVSRVHLQDRRFDLLVEDFAWYGRYLEQVSA